MNFRRGRREDYPEINLIPFIDILLVIVIFLAVTTTYARFAELKINLPTSSAAADAESAQADRSGGGRRMAATRSTMPRLAMRRSRCLANALKQAAGNQQDPVVVINADARAAHQSVVNVMEAARRVGSRPHYVRHPDRALSGRLCFPYRISGRAPGVFTVLLLPSGWYVCCRVRTAPTGLSAWLAGVNGSRRAGDHRRQYHGRR